MAANRVELRKYIRFQLSQLAIENAAHSFESLCYELARLRVASNLLIATGPVQSGGDQGRDFESYRTFLVSATNGNALFFGHQKGELLVGACTLAKDVVRKIKRDLKAIFADGERPSLVIYYCEREIAVAQRHSLQEHCAKMQSFVDRRSPLVLRQKARYEITVAELRGKGSLDPALSHLRSYFNYVTKTTRPANLVDAAVLLSYAENARRQGHTSLSKTSITRWARRLDALLYSILQNTAQGADRCSALEALAMISYVPRSNREQGPISSEQIIAPWRDTVTEIRVTPLYPASHIADVLEVLTPLLGHSEAFRDLARDVDELVAERTGAHEMGDRARRRSIIDLKNGARVAAIDELQRARVAWFAGDTMAGSILAMLLLSQTYEELRLHAAARYYAAAAFFVALHHDDHSLKKRIAHAATRVADTFHASGHGLSFFHAVDRALKIHDAVATNPDDWSKHDDIRRMVAHAAIYRVVAARFERELLPDIDRAMNQWPLAESELAHIKKGAEETWAGIANDEAYSLLASQLGVYPFSDIEVSRTLRWAALGITWSVETTSERWNRCAGLELAATLQVVQVEFADVDLALVPSVARIIVDLHDEQQPEIVQLADNGQLAWHIKLPRRLTGVPLEDYCFELASVAIVILRQASLLNEDAFGDIVKRRMERGLPLRTLVVRPVRELMELVEPDEEEWLFRYDAAPHRAIEPLQVIDLAWRDEAGPGYSRQSAEENIEARYQTVRRTLNISLPRLVADDRSYALMLRLRQNGLLDWQILSIIGNVVIQYQDELAHGRPSSRHELRLQGERLFERLRRKESDSDPPFDLNVLTEEIVQFQERMLLVVTLKSWNLECVRVTPDFAAIRRLLVTRYQYDKDDVPHDDPFLR